MTVTSRHRVQLTTKTLKTIPKSFSYRRHQWGLETDLVFVDAVDDGLRDAHGAVRVLDRRHVHWVPGNRGLSGGENFLDSHRDLRTNAVSGDQRDCAGLTANRGNLYFENKDLEQQVKCL